MSIYDYRDRPAYSDLVPKLRDAENRHILAWWTPLHDDLIASEIARMQWLWYWGITAAVVSATPSQTIELWKNSDPACSKHVWYNVIMYFAVMRAQVLGLPESIRKPLWKECLLCNHCFLESSLPAPLVQRLGIDRIEFCSLCLRGTVLGGTGSHSVCKEDIISYLSELANLTERVPSQGYGEGMKDLLDMSSEQRVALLKLLGTKPTSRCVKQVFGSWLKALIEAGVLDNNTRHTGRGVQCLANDGHVCLSLAEKTIDDFLHARGVRHAKEPSYPEGGYRGDFKIGDTLIEYFGLTGDPKYDAKTREKILICKKHRIPIISIYPQDLVSLGKLERKLAPIMSAPLQPPERL